MSQPEPEIETFEDGIVICGEFGSEKVAQILEKQIEQQGKFNLIVADPPYGNVVSASWDKNISDQDYMRWTKDCLRYLTEGGSLYIWGGIGKPRDRVFFTWLSKVEEETGMTMRNLITWKKRRAYGKADDYLFVREECAWLINGEKPKIFHIPLLAEKRGYPGFNAKFPAKSEFYRRGNIWTENELFRNKVNIAQKPEKLAGIMIETHTDKGDWVMDPFAGSGSSGLAARVLGRKFVLVERDPENFRLICKRLKDNDHDGTIKAAHLSE